MKTTKSLTKKIFAIMCCGAILLVGSLFALPQTKTAVYAETGDVNATDPGAAAYTNTISFTVSNFSYGMDISGENSSFTVSNVPADLKFIKCVLTYANCDTITGTTTINEVRTYWLSIVFESTVKNAYYFENTQQGNFTLYKYGTTITSNHDLAGGIGVTGYNENTGAYWNHATAEYNTYFAVRLFYNPHAIVYDDNVDDSSVTNMPEADSTTYMNGQQITVSSTTPTRTGYTFKGWNTNKDASTGLSFTNGKYTMENSKSTLYAIWEENTGGTTPSAGVYFDSTAWVISGGIAMILGIVAITLIVRKSN